MPINLGAAYLGQTSVNGPPTGFTPEALAGMGGYTVFTSDWTSGAAANVAKSTYQNAVGIVFTLNGMSISIPGIICNLGSKGAGPDGDGDDKGDGGDGNKGSGNDGTWYGMTTSTEASGPTHTIFDSGYGDKLTVNTSNGVRIGGKEGKYYNINVGFDEKGNLSSLSVNNFGVKMTISLPHFGMSGGFSFGGYHSTAGFQINHGFNFTGSFGHAQGKFDNSLNFSFRPGLYTGAAVTIGGVSVFQPEIPAVVVPIILY